MVSERFRLFAKFIVISFCLFLFLHIIMVNFFVLTGQIIIDESLTVFNDDPLINSFFKFILTMIICYSAGFYFSSRVIVKK